MIRPLAPFTVRPLHKSAKPKSVTTDATIRAQAEAMSAILKPQRLQLRRIAPRSSPQLKVLSR